MHFSMLLNILCNIILKGCPGLFSTARLYLIYSFSAFWGISVGCIRIFSYTWNNTVVPKSAFPIISLGQISRSAISVSEVCTSLRLSLYVSPKCFSGRLFRTTFPQQRPLGSVESGSLLLFNLYSLACQWGKQFVVCFLIIRLSSFARSYWR